MSTLRGFVASVLAAEGTKSRLFSKPDSMAQIFELRRLTAEQSRRRPTTDFFEYYWAHHMDGTKLGHLLAWFRMLLFRWPWNIPAQLRVLWTLSWLLAGGAIGFVIANQLGSSGDAPTSAPSVFLAAAFAALQAAAVATLGDAARYLSPLPANIAARHAIRAEGVALLKELHESGRYDRIVLVGHSLGSVIGYDILTILWSQMHAVHDELDRPRQPCIEETERLGRELTESSASEEIETFQIAQRSLWAEQRAMGNPWLVTDFVTLGSPLTHAELLLASGSADLHDRQEQLELPTCPPMGELRRRNSTVEHFHYLMRYRLKGEPRSVRVLHHAALFAVTRWSNVHVRVRFRVLGDLVGGPLRAIFGLGIHDVQAVAGWREWFPLASHTRYWSIPRKRKVPGSITQLQATCRAIDLEARAWIPPRAKPIGENEVERQETASLGGSSQPGGEAS